MCSAEEVMQSNAGFGPAPKARKEPLEAELVGCSTDGGVL
jgi:hypothetical protein